MFEAVKIIKENRLKVAVLTNNFVVEKDGTALSLPFIDARSRQLFDVVGFLANIRCSCIVSYRMSSSSPSLSSPSHQLRRTRHLLQFVESSKFGRQKPDPVVYHETLQQLGCQPNEVVFLDDQEKNLKPAREMGMTTIEVSGARLCSFWNHANCQPSNDLGFSLNLRHL